MPQWDFLNFIAEKAKAYPQFHLRMECEVTDLLEEGGRIAGVRAKRAQGGLEVRADLTLGADGRQSIVREKAGLEVIDLGVPIDVLWMRLSRAPGGSGCNAGTDPRENHGDAEPGRLLAVRVCDSERTGGGDPAGRVAGIPRSDCERGSVPERRMAELQDWDQIKLLTVKLDHLRQWWRSGLLCLGDSAHAMSPVGGVGINLAIQDAVAAANILASSLLRGPASDELLRAVERRREFPTQMTQWVQRLAHKNVFAPVLSDQVRHLPLAFRLLQKFPVLRRVPARVVGMGFRPEHVRTGEKRASARAVVVS